MAYHEILYESRFMRHCDAPSWTLPHYRPIHEEMLSWYEDEGENEGENEDEDGGENEYTKNGRPHCSGLSNADRRFNILSDSGIIPSQQNYIEKLPTELLIRVFHASQPQPCVNARRSGVNYIMNLHISAVCSLWRQIARSTPSLWSAICGTPEQSEIAQLFLELSKTHPLEVHLTFTTSPINTIHINAFLDLFLQHSKRWRRLYVNWSLVWGAENLSLMAALKHAELPLLEELNINLNSAFGLEYGFLQNATALKVGYIMGTVLCRAITPPTVSKLVDLYVDDLSLEREDERNKFREVLRHTTQLQRLHIRDYSHTSYIPSAETNKPSTISLSKLSYLSLNETAFGFCSTLALSHMSHLDFAVCMEENLEDLSLITSNSLLHQTKSLSLRAHTSRNILRDATKEGWEVLVSCFPSVVEVYVAFPLDSDIDHEWVWTLLVCGVRAWPNLQRVWVAEVPKLVLDELVEMRVTGSMPFEIVVHPSFYRGISMLAPDALKHWSSQGVSVIPSSDKVKDRGLTYCELWVKKFGYGERKKP